MRRSHRHMGRRRDLRPARRSREIARAIRALCEDDAALAERGARACLRGRLPHAGADGRGLPRALRRDPLHPRRAASAARTDDPFASSPFFSASTDMNRRPDSRLLRLEPRLGVLEQCGHATIAGSPVLCTSAGTASRSTSRTRSTAEAPRHRRSALGRSSVYPGARTSRLRCLRSSGPGADVIVKASGVGVFDELLEARCCELEAAGRPSFWDVDAPATPPSSRSRRSGRPVPHARAPLRPGPHLRRRRARWCAATARSVRAPASRSTTRSIPTPTSRPRPIRGSRRPRLRRNRLPDREARVEEFFSSAASLPHRRFLLGGTGWEDKGVPANVRTSGTSARADHNAFNATPLAVLNVRPRQHGAKRVLARRPACSRPPARPPASSPTTGRGSSISSSPSRDPRRARAATRSEVSRADPRAAPRARPRRLPPGPRRHTYRARAEVVEAVLGFPRASSWPAPRPAS